MPPITSHNVLRVDWRERASTDNLKLRLTQWLITIDRTRVAKVIRSSGRIAELIEVDADGLPSPGSEMAIWLRSNHMREISPSNIQGRKYLVHTMVIAKDTLQRLDMREPIFSRAWRYRMSQVNMSHARAVAILEEIALSLGVHPYTLGVVPDFQGQFFVPEGWMVKSRECYDIFDFANHTDLPNQTRARGVRMHSTLAGRADNIPSLVVDLSLEPCGEQAGKKIIAVVVMEHRNIKSTIDRMYQSNKEGQRNMLFVLTGGFSDIPSREFLHLLSKDPTLQETPFVFLSDHDPSAFEIYSNMKYGSKSYAWASHICSCPQLQWIGPSFQNLEDSYHMIPGERLQHLLTRRQHNNSTEAERQAAFTGIERDALIRIQQVKNSSMSRFTKSDLMRVRHLKGGILAREKEPKLANELDLMVEHGGMKFSLQMFDRRPLGIERCIMEQVKEHILELERPAPLPEPTAIEEDREPAQMEDAQAMLRILAME
ncbi:putative meiosis-specific topoisomerase spo11 [Phaeomoniella chlamydospora]|uniref:Putative meiosis-specific topoisomerase spo11 n=1 Tax=Phaeomoniella chlamydospora TaxID=158046 RepID=A0A0G2E8Q8_PHACM|nr:putative meiosis-specific topoisomerase spo11 [Phaeomoniella chlamydospora]